MAQKKAYSRYFIILQQDENGYSLASDKLPSGYAKLETKNDKCKISYYVQNLKKELEPYYMALVCNKRDVKKLIKLGAMNIDDYGRAEITFEYGVDNVAGSRMPVDMISGAAIIKFVDSSIISVMSGFSTTDIPAGWKAYEVYEADREEVRNEASEDVLQPSPQAEAEQAEKPAEQPAAQEEAREEKNIFDEYEKKIEEVKSGTDLAAPQIEISETAQQEQETRSEELESDQSVQLEAGEEDRHKKKPQDKCNHEHKDDDECKHKDDDKCEHEHKKDDDECDHDHKKVKDNDNHDHKKDDNKHKHKHEDKCEYPTGTVGEFFKTLAEGFEEVKGSCEDIKRCKWYKVKVDNMDDMCDTSNYNKYTIMYYPMISYYPYIKKQGHYLIGYKYDVNGTMKYLVYGVPGTKSKMDQPYGGKSGFVTWVPAVQGEEREDSSGYWLMFYDFRTSTIVIPIK